MPVTADVRGVCELLGLDPLYFACEGTMVVVVPAGFGSAAVQALRSVPVAAQAAHVGQAVVFSGSAATIRRGTGRLQPLDSPAGMLLPRIC